MNTARTASKATKIAALIERGATEGERAAARNALTALVRRHGLRACIPSHPLASESIVCEWDLLEALEAGWDFSRYVNTSKWDDVTKAAAWAALPAWGAKTLGRALSHLRARKAAGWENGVWTGGEDLRYLNVITWPLERAYRHAAKTEGWSDEDATRYLKRTTARMAA